MLTGVVRASPGHEAVRCYTKVKQPFTRHNRPKESHKPLARRDGTDPERVHEVVTFITSDGLVQLPKWQAPSKVFKLKQHTPLPTWQEQGLCIGNTFWVTATNGLDICRRLNLMGYCRCTELLSDVVEHTVLSSGGEIVIREHKNTSGLHESLHMTVAIPMLWGIPPRHETLSTAIVSGGGYVDKVYRQWQLYGS